jgi:hypothetical protein
VLGFRDEAFPRYYTSSSYLNLIERKFGAVVRDHVLEMTKVRLRRKLLESPTATSKLTSSAASSGQGK